MAISPVLILFAHPAIEGSRVNKPMMDAVAGLQDVTVHDLYEAYPDFDVDIGREQSLVEIHDVIVFHHPMRWYNCPALLKEWFDQVLTQGWAYGDGAVALVGKRAMSAVSTGGSAAAFTPEGGKSARNQRFPTAVRSNRSPLRHDLPGAACVSRFSPCQRRRDRRPCRRFSRLRTQLARRV